eukprot:TRINITY_DN6275_c0_g1_i1.p2 TRINITY_DN6275_c0_g1~~TRINITY_DN6275_c0_g1_i1.p2  ORF type:complete len:319 (-),score=8.79 TRINITY_DN6275_c0_g1_i1:1828-2784(-)
MGKRANWQNVELGCLLVQDVVDCPVSLCSLGGGWGRRLLMLLECLFGFVEFFPTFDILTIRMGKRANWQNVELGCLLVQDVVDCPVSLCSLGGGWGRRLLMLLECLFGFVEFFPTFDILTIRNFAHSPFRNPTFHPQFVRSTCNSLVRVKFAVMVVEGEQQINKSSFRIFQELNQDEQRMSPQLLIYFFQLQKLLLSLMQMTYQQKDYEFPFCIKQSDMEDQMKIKVLSIWIHSRKSVKYCLFKDVVFVHNFSFLYSVNSCQKMQEFIVFSRQFANLSQISCYFSQIANLSILQKFYITNVYHVINLSLISLFLFLLQ